MLPNKNQKLFIDLTLYFSLELHDKADEPIIELQKKQKENRDALLNELAKILLSYTIIDSTLSLTSGERNTLYSKLGKIVDDNIKKELKNETYIMEEIFSNTCLEKYNTNNYIYNLGADFKIKQVKKDILDEIINSKIDGEIWSNRLWTNKNEIAKDLKVQVKKLLKGEINVNEIEKIIKTKYNANSFNTSRLVRTEVAKCQSGANEYWAKDNGVKKQLFVATLDNRTSKICQSKDTTVWDIDDIDKPIPPLHPNCRSCLVNLPSNDQWRPKQRYDNENRINVNWTDYESWQKKQES
jgi:SPP1 gp7 family putative phage head morphogenesis protein